MAKFTLSEKQYIEFMTDRAGFKLKRDILKIISFSIIILFFVIILYLLKQYVSSILIFIIYIYIGFFWKYLLKISSKKFYRKNKFFLESIQIIFNKDNIVVNYKNNKLNLSVNDINYIERKKDIYYFTHPLGIKLFIPINSLNKEEKELINYYLNSNDKK